MHLNFIETFDGGHDDLKPGRWMARLSEWKSDVAYGSTEADAVNNLKEFLKANYPKIWWYEDLPVVRVER